MTPKLFKAADQAGLVLDLLHGGLRPDDHIPDALTGNALIFGNFGKGKVFIIIKVYEIALLLSEHYTVEIK